MACPRASNMSLHVATIIPCYCVKEHILDVISGVGPEVHAIYVVDDACPDQSGSWVEANCSDARVKVLRHTTNRGVGAAVMTGYRTAMDAGADILVKLDGDGQMNPRLIPQFIAPLIKGQVDYTKGNRFYDLKHIGQMPAVRLVGNAVLSFMAKLSTGYWNLFDTTNGYTAIHAKVARRIDFEKVSERYFFETDMLFHLNIARAMVVDIPMDAVYGNEKSSLRVGAIIGEFLGKHMRNFGRRVLYSYFLRDMNVASLELVVGCALLLFGLLFGTLHWAKAVSTGMPTPLGTIMLAALPTMLGLQMVLAFISFDVANVPQRPIHQDLPNQG